MKIVVYNVNDDMLDGSEDFDSDVSCITNCFAPVLKVLQNNFCIVKGNMTIMHAYTNDHVTLDVAHKNGNCARRGRVLV